MDCENIIRRNYEILQRLAYDLEVKNDIEKLIKGYISIFTSYEKERERLRIIGVTKNNKKRETILLIGKRVLKRKSVDMYIVQLKAELFCKLWQQTKNIGTIQKQEEEIQKNINKLEELTGDFYL